jgi:hypothetical protein
VKLQATVVLQPAEIRQPGGVGQEDSRCEPFPAVVAGKVPKLLVLGERTRQERSDRGIERESPLVDKLQDHVGEGGLGQRGAIEHRIRSQWELPFEIPVAEGSDLCDPARSHDGDCHSDDAVLGHETADLAGQGRTGRRRPLRFCASAARRRGRQQQHQKKTGLHAGALPFRERTSLCCYSEWSEEVTRIRSERG